MNDERFEELMRDAAETYRRPPVAPLEQMWRAIDREAFAGARSGSGRALATRLWRSQLTRIAAALVIGIGIGRLWTQSRTAGSGDGAGGSAGSSAVASRTAASVPLPADASEPYDVATSKYLGQAAALLIALPSEARGGRTDRGFVTRAGDLLLTTRLLLDSPASADPTLRDLLEDLELVLAQIVRLRDERGRTELELINQALEQREVLPRLRSAVADISADDD